jgi:hypothetical protein
VAERRYRAPALTEAQKCGMARNFLDEDFLRQCAARYRRLVSGSKSDVLIKQYQGLAALLEKEAASWRRLPSRPPNGC